MKKLFTERYGAVVPRVKEELDKQCATGLLSILEARIAENWFGEAFPAECEDGGWNAGCDISKLQGAVAAYNLIWPGDWRKADQVPSDGLIFDLIEFSYEHVALPEPYTFHSHWRHDHFNYDQETGRATFTEDINRVLSGTEWLSNWRTVKSRALPRPDCTRPWPRRCSKPAMPSWTSYLKRRARNSSTSQWRFAKRDWKSFGMHGSA